jgi:glycosyltransferase involved in cell wall biosynthesis
MKTPTVSVVMSVFNGQAFLVEAIESILGQTFRNFEFVIVDDGSTDSTPKILNTFAKQDERIRILRHANKGRAESLNIGIGLANGEYIARMDADDIALQHRLEDQIVFMAQHPEVGLLSGAYERFSSEGRAIDIVRPPLRDDEIRLMMLRTSAMCHPAVMMKRDIALLSGGYRKPLLDADDYDLWLRMSERTRLANLEQPILRYRVHPKQSSISNSSHQVLCVLAARTASVMRRSGKPDPLTGIHHITPQLLTTLGVTKAEIQDSLLANHREWQEIIGKNEPEMALTLIEEFLRIGSAGFVERRVLADLWLKAADIHYAQNRPWRALSCAGRGLLVRPIVAGRPLKRAFMRRTEERSE